MSQELGGDNHGNERGRGEEGGKEEEGRKRRREKERGEGRRRRRREKERGGRRHMLMVSMHGRWSIMWGDDGAHQRRPRPPVGACDKSGTRLEMATPMTTNKKNQKHGVLTMVQLVHAPVGIEPARGL